MKYKIMMGVLSGYGGKNLPPKETLNIGTNVVKDNLGDDVDVKLASAVYLKEWGCPEGGELGVTFSGEVESEEQKQELIDKVKNMMKDLGQNTVTINWFEEDKGLGSTYISERGEKIEEFLKETQEVLQEKSQLESFSVKIPTEKVDFTDMGIRLQLAMSKINGFKPSVDSKGLYATTGILTLGIDKNGNKYYEYSATQNPAYGQTDTELYRQSVIMMVGEAVEGLGNVIVEFNGEQVVVKDLIDSQDKGNREIESKPINTEELEK